MNEKDFVQRVALIMREAQACGTTMTKCPVPERMDIYLQALRAMSERFKALADLCTEYHDGLEGPVDE